MQKSPIRPDDQLLTLDSVISVCMMMHWEYIDVSCETTEDDIEEAINIQTPAIIERSYTETKPFIITISVNSK